MLSFRTPVPNRFFSADFGEESSGIHVRSDEFCYKVGFSCYFESPDGPLGFLDGAVAALPEFFEGRPDPDGFPYVEGEWGGDVCLCAGGDEFFVGGSHEAVFRRTSRDEVEDHEWVSGDRILCSVGLGKPFPAEAVAFAEPGEAALVLFCPVREEMVHLEGGASGVVASPHERDKCSFNSGDAHVGAVEFFLYDDYIPSDAFLC